MFQQVYCKKLQTFKHQNQETINKFYRLGNQTKKKTSMKNLTKNIYDRRKPNKKPCMCKTVQTCNKNI